MRSLYSVDSVVDCRYPLPMARKLRIQNMGAVYYVMTDPLTVKSWSRICIGLGLAFLLWGAASVRANLPGGFAAGVTTPVTTGLEPFGKRTDRYLDNGILHVLVATDGNVDSIKYLKPGNPGTPATNGIEMVSQFGVKTGSFGEHTCIYYYWYPDVNRGASYFSTANSGTNIDLGYLRTYQPTRDKVVADVAIHYSLGQGNSALYVYLVVSHPSQYRIYPDCHIGFMQMIWPVAHDATDFLCEKMFIDHGVKTGLSQNQIYQTRDALEPDFLILRGS